MNFTKYKLSNRDLKLLIIFIALVILFASYRFVYFPNMQNTKKINDEVKQLQVREEELQLKNSKVDEVLDKNDMLSNEINDIINRYGAGATTQKTLIFLENMEKETGMDISVIGFSEPENIYSSASDENTRANNSSTVESTSTEDGTADGDGIATENGAAVTDSSGEISISEKEKSNTISGYNSIVSIEFKVNSDGLNKSIDYINNNSERKNISEINVVYDMETGNLSGSMQINMYQLTDTGKSYEDPAIAGVDIGTQNIFGTIDMAGVTNN